MAKKSKFVYRGEDRTAESEMRSAKSAGRTFDSYIDSAFQAIKVKEGENQYRILPATWKDKEKWGTGWQIPIYVHYNIGPDNGVYLCRAKMGKGECPICKARAEAEDDDEADAFKVSERRLAWVIDRDDERAGPQPWPMPASLYKDIATRSIDKKTRELLLIDHPDEGFDLMFTREGTDKKTRYTGVEFDRDDSPLHDKESTMNKWLDFIEENPLPSILKFYDEEYLEKMLAGKAKRKSDDDDDDEDEDDDRSSRRKRRSSKDEDEDEKPRSRRRSSKDEEEDEDEDEKPRSRRRSRDEEEDEDEDEKPRSRRRSSKEEEEDEDEDEKPRRRRSSHDEEDEDEDEKPRSRRRSSKEEEDEDEDEKPRSRRSRDKEEEEEDEDEDEKPRTRRRVREDEDDLKKVGRGKSKKKEEDEEDDDVPFEDEEEDEPPKKKGKERLGGLKKRRGGK